VRDELSLAHFNISQDVVLVLGPGWHQDLRGGKK
jgi:hypothetical protein